MHWIIWKKYKCIFAIYVTLHWNCILSWNPSWQKSRTCCSYYTGSVGRINTILFSNHTVQWIFSKFTTAHLWGWGMGCLLWVQSLMIHGLCLSLHPCIQYCATFSLHYNSTRLFSVLKSFSLTKYVYWIQPFHDPCWLQKLFIYRECSLQGFLPVVFIPYIWHVKFVFIVPAYVLAPTVKPLI